MTDVEVIIGFVGTGFVVGLICYVVGSAIYHVRRGAELSLRALD